ncbi:chemotaxis protein CheA [Sphingomonas hylomeconis]|uniref:histidine kinase n=1 Tax=Sphingomonas hylomeconis TaxID=1395958 RepID=A0ABV7SW80_9SPHN|nr:chemotaxis protein CheA [Sphingomonas hylomeconis]
MDDLLPHFLVEARELIAQAEDDLTALARDGGDGAAMDSAFRAIHTLKGSVAIFDMAAAGRALHAAEDLLERMRAGTKTLTAADLATLVALIDQTDTWIDAMAQHGALPDSADAAADALIAGMAGMAGGSDAPAAIDPTAPAPWLEALLAAHAHALGDGALVAFRYRPDGDCFFRGDDPLAIVAAIADLRVLEIMPATDWPALDALTPFDCMVTLTGISGAPLAELRRALRFVIDQVEIVAVAPPAPARPPLSTAPAAPAPPRAAPLRVDGARIDALADGVGELIVANNALAHLADEIARTEPRVAARIRAAHATLARAVGDLGRAVSDVRMVAIGPSLRRLPRLVREIADALGKSVTLEIAGEQTEIDKSIADDLFEPLLHIVRNALDHGIEPPETRRQAGKPDHGRLTVAARREGDAVVIEIADDGAGIDSARLRAVAVARGVLAREAADALDDAQALRLIFAPGFSTASAVTAISGRGVGMDAVLTVVERLGGRVDISSIVGQGSAIRLRLPLDAILTRLLIVRCGEERYGIPLDSILETASVPSARIVPVGSGRACVLRDRTVAVLSLAALLGGKEPTTPPEPVSVTKLLVTQTEVEPVGIIVDGFGARIDGLVRPKAGLLAHIPGVAGTTLLGDGSVLLVLDLPVLIA